MSKAASTHAAGAPAAPARTKNAYLLVSFAGLAYSLIVQPLIVSACDPFDIACTYASRPDNKIIWPALAVISLVLLVNNWRRVFVPPNIACLFAFVAFAGMSVVWAYNPELSAIRYLQQVMVVMSIVIPPLIVTRKGDLLRGLFLCFAAASIMNVFYVLGPPPKLPDQATIGHIGYFTGKNYLGLCAAIAVLISIYEMTHSGTRRLSGILVFAFGCFLLLQSNAKTSTGLLLICPVLAGAAVLLRKTLRVSVLVIPLSILATYIFASLVANFDAYKLSYWIYGESTFTGRRFLWEFAQYHIANRPLLGWGYQSFWLVGPDAPSVTTATGWIKTMPNAHSGYFDTALEMGYVGLSILLIFVFTTVHATGQLIDRAPVRGWIVTTMMFFLIVTNFLESMWMRGFEFPWLVFLLLAAEVGRSQKMHHPADLRVQATPVPAIEGQRRTRGRRTIPTRNNQPRRPNIACNNVPNPNIG